MSEHATLGGACLLVQLSQVWVMSLRASPAAVSCDMRFEC